MSDEIKIANIIQFNKSKATDEFSNYIPISLSPSISKKLGKVVSRRTYDFIQKNNILNNNQ